MLNALNYASFLICFIINFFFINSKFLDFYYKKVSKIGIFFFSLLILIFIFLFLSLLFDLISKGQFVSAIFVFIILLFPVSFIYFIFTRAGRLDSIFRNKDEQNKIAESMGVDKDVPNSNLMQESDFVLDSKTGEYAIKFFPSIWYGRSNRRYTYWAPGYTKVSLMITNQRIYLPPLSIYFDTQGKKTKDKFWFIRRNPQKVAKYFFLLLN